MKKCLLEIVCVVAVVAVAAFSVIIRATQATIAAVCTLTLSICVQPWEYINEISLHSI